MMLIQKQYSKSIWRKSRSTSKIQRSTSKKWFNNIRQHSKNRATGEGDDYTTRCLLDYNCFNKYYKMISIDLHKKQALDADPKAIQQISFTGTLGRGRNFDGKIANDNRIMFFIIEKSKEIF